MLSGRENTPEASSITAISTYSSKETIVNLKRLMIAAILILLLAGCTPTPETSPENESEPEAAEATSPPADTSVADQETEEVQEDAETTIPSATEAPEIIHQVKPESFVMTPLQRITDCRLGGKTLENPDYVFDNGVCDIWDQNFFERPVTEDLAEYYPQADIIRVEFGEDENWYYSRVYLFSEGLDQLTLDAVYALEIDLNLDARGDILILISNPAAQNQNDWSVSGVQVWLDSNDDIGGPRAVLPDENPTGNGYEELVFDSGLGDDPDLAWFRISEEENGLLEISFKKSLLNGVEVFEWWAWASRDDVTTDKFDPVDFYSPDSLFALDNTCGWIYGAGPRNLPNLCEVVLIQPTKSPNKPSGGGPCSKPPTCGDGPGTEIWHGEPDCYCQIFN